MVAKIPKTSLLDQQTFAYVALRRVDFWGGDTDSKHYPNLNTAFAEVKKRIANDESKCATIVDNPNAEVYYKILSKTNPVNYGIKDGAHMNKLISVLYGRRLNRKNVHIQQL